MLNLNDKLMPSSAANVSVGLQKELRTLEKRLNEAVATKSAEPDHVSLVPDKKSLDAFSSAISLRLCRSLLNLSLFEVFCKPLFEKKFDYH